MRALLMFLALGFALFAARAPLFADCITSDGSSMPPDTKDLARHRRNQAASALWVISGPNSMYTLDPLCS